MPSLLSGYAGALQAGDASLILFLIKATLILLCALGVTFAMHRAAAGARHIVWLVTLGGLLLVPALTVWGPLRLHILPPARVVTVAAPPVASPSANAALQREEARRTDAVAGPQVNAQTPRREIENSPIVSAPTRNWTSSLDPIVLLFGAWLVVALAIGLSLAYATLSLHRVVRASKPLNGPDWLNAVWEVSDRLGLPRTPRLRQSSATKMPFACGLLHPTVILPAESEGWSPERRRAVLLHELAHVRRRDLIGHTIGRIACAVYWFHPLVWTAAKRLRSESERACDDLALMCGTRAADYAEHLLEIVTSVRHDRTPMVALAMARRKEFEGRMLAILDPQLQRRTPNRWKTGAMVGSLGLLSLAIGAAAPVSRTSVAQPAGQSSRRVLDGAVRTQPTRSESPAPEQTARLRPRSPVADTDSLTDFSTAMSRFGARVATTVATGVIADVNVDDITRRTLDATGAAMARLGGADFSSELSFGLGAGAKTPDERAQLLVKVLQSDTSASLRHTAAWGLARYAESPVASVALTQSLRHDASASVRETSAWALARDHGAASSVVEALSAAVRSDASDSVRATSAWALGELHDDAAAPTLTSALSDRAAKVRARAIWALGEIHPATAPAALVARLADSDTKVRKLTAWALFTIRDTTAAPALQSALSHETDKDLQVDYIHALAAMGGRSVSAIRNLLESPDPRIKTMAVDVLAGGQAAGPWPWPWPDPRPFP